MEDKILCNVSDLEPIADAVREKENTNKLYSVEELKVKIPELISSDSESTVQIQTGTVTSAYNNDEGLYMFDVRTDFSPDYLFFEHIYSDYYPVYTAGFDFTIKTSSDACVSALPYGGVDRAFMLSAIPEEDGVITLILPVSFSGISEPNSENLSVNYTAIKL